MTKKQRLESKGNMVHALGILLRMSKADMKLLRYAIKNNDLGVFRSSTDVAQDYCSTARLSQPAFFCSVVRLRELGCLTRIGKGLYQLNDIWL